jgi:hypothetical protein
MVGGPFSFTSVLTNSYQLIPINKLLSPLFFSTNVPFGNLMAKMFLGISLKSWAFLALLCATWIFIVKQLGKESLAWGENY